MTILTLGHYQDFFRTDADEALGFQCSGRSVLCPVAGQYFSGTTLRKELADCVAAGQWASVWMAPGTEELDQHKVDIPNLPNHPDVLDAIEAIKEHGKACVVRIGFEFANRCTDKTFQYVSPQVFVAMFDAIAAKLPANAIPSWDYEPSANVAFAAWKPKLAKAAGIDLYGRPAVDETQKKGAHAAVFCETAKGWGLPVWSGEAGCIDVPDISTTGDKLARDGFFKKLLTFAVVHDLKAVPITNENYGGYSKPPFGWMSGRWAAGKGFPPTHKPPLPDWTGAPLTTAFLKKTLASPLFGKAQPEALVAAGMVPA